MEQKVQKKFKIMIVCMSVFAAIFLVFGIVQTLVLNSKKGELSLLEIQNQQQSAVQDEVESDFNYIFGEDYTGDKEYKPSDDYLDDKFKFDKDKPHGTKNDDGTTDDIIIVVG